ncbi:MAG: nucleotide sugar dehydrogenase [Patescibacteria group bacterium]|jgi:nucleotide sugar dehydrogenase
MKINKKFKIGIIGMGYVGVPLAAVAASKGYQVYGFDTDKKRLKIIAQGKSPFKEDFLEKLLPKVKINVFSDSKILKKCDICIICVPTPVDEKYYPILDPVINASKTIAKNLKKGALVILESTVNPGVCEDVILPIFIKAGYRLGKDFFIAHCPERVNPGDPKWNVGNIPRVVGAFEKVGLKMAKQFYESIVDGQIMEVDSIREAEAVKILENSFRDINIAFVNELAKSFGVLNIDIVNVIKGASTKPFSFMPHWPSCGVGGHCIPVDPYYLIEKAKSKGFDHSFLRTARAINNSMPEYTAEQMFDLLNEVKKSVKGTKIGILGLSYKANVGDLRESPSLKIKKILEKKGAVIETYDPYLPELSTVKNLNEILKKTEAILLAANHDEFKQITAEKLKSNKVFVVVDGKNCLDKKSIQKIGVFYRGIGR